MTDAIPPRFRARRRRSRRRGVAIVMVVGALTILTVMLTEFQDETSAEFGSALSERDAVKAEYAAKSAINLSRLLIASEPTVRKALSLLFIGARTGSPQIPVWEFANQALGAFNDASGTEAFAAIASVRMEDGKNLGFEGAGFQLEIVDEDSKINANLAARGEAFSQIRLAGQLIGLMAGAQYDPLFEQRDFDGQFSDRQAICSAVIDWIDPDQDNYVCDPNAGAAQQTGAEDSFYQLLKKPYARKNAAFDSLEELKMVRGIGDDFWATFVDPEPDNPRKRVLTVWGQGQINVNTANAQTILAFLCSPTVAPQSPFCTDLNQAGMFLGFVSAMRAAIPGAPIFSSPKAFINALKGKGPLGSLLSEALNLKPAVFLSEAEAMKAITTESKVFSIYATGYVRAGKRETRVRIHAVVDFRGAPPPGAAPQAGGSGGSGGTDGTDGSGASGTGGTGAAGTALDPNALLSAMQPNAGGNIVYYRLE